MGATGAVYAIRRELFEPIPEDTLLDDVLIPLRIVRRGYRVLFEPAARAWDRVAASAGEELAPKGPHARGQLSALRREPWLLDPRPEPHLARDGVAQGPASPGPRAARGRLRRERGAWRRSPLYRAALVVQVLFYALALAGHAMRNSRRRSALLSVPYVVCLLNWATVVGFLRFRHGAPERVVGSRVRFPAPGHCGMETTASVTVELRASRHGSRRALGVAIVTVSQ